MFLSDLCMRRRLPSPICEECVHIASLRLRYRLYKSKETFVLTVSDGEDIRAASLGTEPCRAFRFYADVVEGTVPPCTFFEIMEEWDEMGVFQKISLQNKQYMV